MTVLTARKSRADLEEQRQMFRLLVQRNRYFLAKTVLGYTDMTDGFHRNLLLWSQSQPAKKKLHMVPRGFFKTSGLTVSGAIQRVLTNPNVRILIASNKAENAQAMLTEIKGHLANNEKLLWAFPDTLVRDPERHAERWTTAQITVKRTRNAKEATIETNGVEGELTSKHYEVGLFDDLVGLENSQTREERQKVIRWFGAAQSLVDQPSPEEATQDISCTPWHADDLYAELLRKRAKGDIDLAVYQRPCWEPDPNGTEVPGYGKVRATFPERFTIPVLLDLRKTIGASQFASQYLLTPTDQETAVFKRQDADPKHPHGVPAIKSAKDAPPLDTLWNVMTIDPAISVKGWADNSAIAVSGFDHLNHQHVRWLQWGRWPETELIARAYLAYNSILARGGRIVVVGFEAIAFQKLFKALFVQEGEKRGLYLPIHGLERDTKLTKQTRQLVLEPGWNSGELILYDDLDALDDLLDMANKFRLGKELTRDDLLDVLADAYQLRSRPHAPDPSAQQFAHLDGLEADKARAMFAAQEQRKAEGAPPLDDASLRMTYAIQRTMQRIEESRQTMVESAW